MRRAGRTERRKRRKRRKRRTIEAGLRRRRLGEGGGWADGWVGEQEEEEEEGRRVDGRRSRQAGAGGGKWVRWGGAKTS